MIAISDLEEVLTYRKGIEPDWTVPCYLLNPAEGPCEIYVWFSLLREGEYVAKDVTVLAEAFLVYKNLALQSLGGGRKSLVRKPDGGWRERSSRFIHSSAIEDLLNRVIVGEAQPISKLVLMTHAIAELRSTVSLPVEAKFIKES